MLGVRDTNTILGDILVGERTPPTLSLHVHVVGLVQYTLSLCPRDSTGCPSTIGAYERWLGEYTRRSLIGSYT